ncbi:POU domain, class 6, transcription factor 1 isoform X2 [Takifugu rubripes]|uniref:POU domain, class 6, transcription factor 1 isoform X2 n=1 Tax=Takifugu rubripes TaxID=31033 RepID=UPI0011453873|nr:POU domain, class 6, transcription factor 1 isoform X2 [Takifugu rubripes]
MNSQDLPTKDGPLTVNEQVIVMSGQETIRVLEVEVDAPPSQRDKATTLHRETETMDRPLPPSEDPQVEPPWRTVILADRQWNGWKEVDAPVPSSAPDGKSEGNAREEEARLTDQPAVGGAQIGNPMSQSPGKEGPGTQLVASEASVPDLHTLTPAVPVSVSLPQPQTTLPITIQGCPQVLSQESLATLMTGMMAQTGSLGQPLLIPLSVPGPIGGQGGVALLTLPTTSLASLPGFAATNVAGNLLKLPFAGLQAATVQTMLQPQAASIQPLQAATQQVTSQPSQVTASQVTAAQAAAAQPTTVATSVSPPNISVAALQTAGLSINPAIFSAASLGAQPQFLSSLTSTPIITGAMSNMAGITSQIITNAQGQVIGTLPLLVNPASLGGGAATPTLPLHGLQVQAVTPQLLFNAQGQIVGTLGNGSAAVATSAAVPPKAAASSALSKPSAQSLVSSATPSPVVIAPQPSVLKTSPTLSSAVPIACGDAAKVGQLVSKPQQGAGGEDGINLEEIREFAKNFKIRRLSLGLTQTQVGQALTATEGPAYSQSAICRFEKLDITPKSAQKLKPVLEKWLAEAEHWNQKGQQNLMEFVGGEPSKKRKRRTSFTPQAIEVLNSYFKKNALPTGQEITEIARELNYDREVVRVWFCNRRQTLKNTSKINVFQAQQ